MVLQGSNGCRGKVGDISVAFARWWPFEDTSWWCSMWQLESSQTPASLFPSFF